MAQSNNKSNVRAIPPFWQNHVVASPIPWEEWSNLFHLAIIGKEKVDIENQPNLSERHHPRPPTQTSSTENELKVQRKTKILSSDIQLKLLTETLSPWEALNFALIHEKEIYNHSTTKKIFISNGSSVHKFYNHFNVK